MLFSVINKQFSRILISETVLSIIARVKSIEFEDKFLLNVTYIFVTHSLIRYNLLVLHI